MDKFTVFSVLSQVALYTIIAERFSFVFFSVPSQVAPYVIIQNACLVCSFLAKVFHTSYFMVF